MRRCATALMRSDAAARALGDGKAGHIFAVPEDAAACRHHKAHDRCYQKFNQNIRSYSHDYEALAITLRFADAASQNLLFTVYSDGVCQVNEKFVFLRSPDGNAEAIYQLLRDAVG